LDAAEEAGILPDVAVTLEVAPSNGDAPPPASQATRFRVTVTDNGPGIVRQQIPPIFAKLLYGSKFHRLRMSRGQQGIGISAAGMYGQLTTGKPVQITSRTSARAPAHYFEVQIDTKKNEPRILEKKQIAWESPRGTQVAMEIEGRYQKGRDSVDEYLEQTIIANPHVKLTYVTPEGETKEYPRTYEQLPPSPREIKPHPYGIELGMLLKMAQDTKSHSLSGFLSSDFSRVSPPVAAEICKTAGLSPNARPRDVHGQAAENLYKAIQSTKIMAQSRGSLPAGPMVIFVHMASVWVPFTSESKEAIAEYDEIHKEITLALRECGRRLGAFLRRRERAHSEFRRRNIFELYIEEIVQSCNRLKGGREEARRCGGPRDRRRRKAQGSHHRDPRPLAVERELQRAQGPDRDGQAETGPVVLQRGDGQEVHADRPRGRRPLRAPAREPHHLAPRDLLPDQAHHQGLAREHPRYAGRVRPAHRGSRGDADGAARGAARAGRKRRVHRRARGVRGRRRSRGLHAAGQGRILRPLHRRARVSA